jgi:hypothetical protein
MATRKQQRAAPIISALKSASRTLPHGGIAQDLCEKEKKWCVQSGTADQFLL